MKGLSINGSTAFGEVQVNQNSSILNTYQYASIAVLHSFAYARTVTQGNGSTTPCFVVVWNSDWRALYQFSIYMQAFSSGGVRLQATQALVNDDTTHYSMYPKIASY